MIDSFILPANGVATPEMLEKRRRIAEALMAQGADYSPIGSPWQGAARMVQALAGGLGMARADRMEQQGRKSAHDALVRAMSGDAGVAPSQQDPNGALLEAMDNPYMSNAGQAMALDLWKQNRPAPPDPMRELQQQKLQLEIDRMRNPQPESRIVPKGSAIYENGKWITPPMGAASGAAPLIEDPMKISKDFQAQPGMERIKTIAPTIESMYRSLQDPSAMADLDFVYGLAKILDPTSVVRESEGRMVIEAQGIGPQLLGQLNKIASGEQAMLPQTRANLFGVAIRRAQELQEQAQTERKFYSNMAQQNQMDPNIYLQQVPGLPKWQQQAVPDLRGAPGEIGIQKPVQEGKANNLSVPPAPPGVDPDLWAHLTPEERALWN